MKAPRMFTSLGGTQAKPNQRSSLCSSSRTKALRCSQRLNKSEPQNIPGLLEFKEKFYEHNYCKRWYDNLLQRLGQGPGRNLFARLAAEFRCMGRPTTFPRPEWLSRGRPRPAWPWPLEPGLVRE